MCPVVKTTTTVMMAMEVLVMVEVLSPTCIEQKTNMNKT
jgi:hypothetical protein